VFAAAVLLSYGVAYQTRGLEQLAPREHGVVTTVAYVLGALLALVAAWIGTWTGRQTSVRVAEGARRSIDEALQVALRGGAVSGVSSQAIGVLGVALAFFVLLGYFGGVHGDWHAAMLQAPRLPLLLAGLGLGAAFVSLLGQLGGGIFGCVADIGADVAGKLEGALPEDAAHNPASIADLVGDQVGDGAARVATGAASAITETLAAMMVAAMIFRDNAALPSVTAVVLFPLTVRAFALLASWFGVIVVRTDDTEVPVNALTRGLFVSALLYSVAAMGCAKWLLGEMWLRLGACALTGIVASLLCYFVVEYYSEQRYRPVRALAETARTGPTLSTLRGLLLACDGALVVLTVVMLAAIAAYHLGSATGLKGGGIFGLALAMGGLCGTSPYVLAMDAMGTVADNAAGILEIAVGPDRPDVHARTRILGAVGSTAKGFSRVLFAVSSCIGCFLFMAMFLDQTSHARAAERSESMSPLVVVGGLLGLMVVIAFGRILLGRIVAAARDLVHELRHQLGVADDSGARIARPLSIDGRTVAHGADDACVEAVSRAALRGMLPPALVGVGAPLVIGVVLRLLATGDSVTRLAEALAAFVLVATIAGGLGSLLSSNAGSAWDNAKRYIETGAHGGRYVRSRTPEDFAERGEGDAETPLAQHPDQGAQGMTPQLNPTYAAAVIGDTIGDPLKAAVGPATQALLATLATLVLVFLPFFL
jgi:K(+)-stimulated pyrophosphate-energized sodium pump